MLKPKQLAVLLALIMFPFAVAIAGVSYGVEPDIIRITAPAGSTQSGVIKFYTRSPQSAKVKVYAADWLYTDKYDGVRAFYPAKSTALSCADWIVFNPSSFIIPPYEVGILNYTVNIPKDAKGGHYAVIFFETSSVTPAEMPSAAGQQGVQSSIRLQLRLGAFFYIEAKGTVKRAVDLEAISLSKVLKRDNYILSCGLKNTGNADALTSGTFHILDNNGKIITRGKFRNNYTMPGDKTELKGEYKNALPKGKYDLVFTLRLSGGAEGKRGGRPFTKEAEIEIGENGELVSSGKFK
ncbi:MAG: hypothetical protein WC469_04730 [Candidatus Omnitrophota bacterium]